MEPVQKYKSADEPGTKETFSPESADGSGGVAQMYRKVPMDYDHSADGLDCLLHKRPSALRVIVHRHF